MNTSKFVIVLTSLVVMALLVGAVFLPVVSSSTTRTVTTIEENEEPGWSRYAYTQTDDYSFGISIEDDTLNIGSQTLGIQTGELYDMMVLSTDVLTIVIDGDSIVAVSEDGAVDLGTSVNVAKTSSGLTVGDATYTAPLWSYYPKATGNYAYFDHADLLTDGKPLSAWGKFAGVYAYSQFTYPDYGLVMDATVTDGVIEGANWGIAPDTLDIQPFHPGDVIFNPIDLDPIDVDIEPIDLGGDDNQIMSADPTTGTRIGDLYYTFSGTDATVIGYSSSINWSTFTTIPDTVTDGGVTYNVTKINDSAFDGCAYLALTELPSGIISIGLFGFRGCTNLALTELPSGITSIGRGAFKDCTNLALTSLPIGVTTIDQDAFNGCTNLAITSIPGNPNIGMNAFSNTGITYLIIEGNPTISSSAFYGSNIPNVVVVGTPYYSNSNAMSGAGIQEVLNLGGGATSGVGYGSATIQDYIDASGYIAPLGITHHEQVAIESPTTDVINLLPLIAGIGVLMIGLAMFITRRL